ncbi:MAG: dihydrolipoyl dehydrogenase [Geobacteraceae bacterium]|nr:dihydrolipoyl dehydrogenase [Geobacteraceae bacterium]
MPDDVFDLIVIGAGPGGYTAAIRASQLGMKVAVVENRGTLGGVCLNEGCIPSKALLDSSELFSLARESFSRHGIRTGEVSLDLAAMMARKDEIVRKLTEGIAFLFRKYRIQRMNGTGKLAGSRRDGLQVVAVTTAEAPAIPKLINGKRVLLATGSRPVELPFLPFDRETVISSKEALSLSTVPGRLVVVGAGYVGLELGSAWKRLGADVTVVEALDTFLPESDRQVADTLLKALEKQGLRFLFKARIHDGLVKEGIARLTIVSGDDTEEIECDKVLVAAGRVPEISGLGLSEAGVRLESNGRIAVDMNYETNVAGVYAIGDLVGGPLLAHKAMEEGAVFAERLAGQASTVEYEFIPRVAYTFPEVASVGMTEQQLEQESIPYRTGRFPFSANGRARALDCLEGFVRILAHKDTGRVLGIHIIGPRASELIAEAVTVMTYGGSTEDIAMTFHAHPTLSEAIREAALDVSKRAIHA